MWAEVRERVRATAGPRIEDCGFQSTDLGGDVLSFALGRICGDNQKVGPSAFLAIRGVVGFMRKAGSIPGGRHSSVNVVMPGPTPIHEHPAALMTRTLLTSVSVLVATLDLLGYGGPHGGDIWWHVS